MLRFLLLFVLVGCSHLFYQGSREIYTTPDQFGLHYEARTFSSKNGALLRAWIIPAQGDVKERRGTVLHFHGNAENMTSHFLNVAWMAKQGFKVIVFDYEGYGESQGEATQEHVNADAIAALELAHQEWKNGGGKRFIVYGQSLGGAVLLRALNDFANSKDISLVVADSTFMSYTKLAFDKLTDQWWTIPLSPLAFLLVSNAYGPSHVIDELPAIPLLVIHGTADIVVPKKFGDAIFARWKGPRTQWVIPEGQHTDVFIREAFRYRKQFVEFVLERL